MNAALAAGLLGTELPHRLFIHSRETAKGSTVSALTTNGVFASCGKKGTLTTSKLWIITENEEDLWRN
jgi:hypothetical protein